jgi:hypothetical protein
VFLVRDELGASATLYGLLDPSGHLQRWCQRGRRTPLRPANRRNRSSQGARRHQWSLTGRFDPCPWSWRSRRRLARGSVRHSWAPASAPCSSLPRSRGRCAAWTALHLRDKRCLSPRLAQRDQVLDQPIARVNNC